MLWNTISEGHLMIFLMNLLIWMMRMRELKLRHGCGRSSYSLLLM